MTNYYELTDLFQHFIRDSKSGLRRKHDGNKIKPQTIKNYEYVLMLLEKFENIKDRPLRVISHNKLNSRKIKIEVNYWKRFYLQFSEFLYVQRKCYDNYVGHVFKIIRTFFTYLEKDKYMQVYLYKHQLYVRKEDIEIITLLPEQIKFMHSNKAFIQSLSPAMNTIREVFIFGCITGLRYSDLINLKFTDIHQNGNLTYLVVKAAKTKSVSYIKIPEFAGNIISKRKVGSSLKRRIFKPISIAHFNKSIRKLGEMAGWTQSVAKARSRNGVPILVKAHKMNKDIRFCDLMSSHTMRRSAITNMLMLGVSEHVVRMVSGHSPHSSSFFKYVNFAQTYIDNEVDKMHRYLQNNQR